ncbi:MAG: Rne/Rng family ribonuclease, partial [Brooklawnia sp.]
MLDNESANTPEPTAIEEDLPRPPTGRRSRTRPAGPPPPAPVEPEAPVESEPAEPVGDKRSPVTADTDAPAQDDHSGAEPEADEPAQVKGEPAKDQDAPVRKTPAKKAAARKTTRSRPAKAAADKKDEQPEPVASPEIEAALEAVQASATTRPRRSTKTSAASLIGDDVPTREDGEVDTQQVLADLAAAIAHKGDSAGELPSRPAPRQLESAKQPKDEQAAEGDQESVVGEQPDLPTDTETTEQTAEQGTDDEQGAPVRRRRRRGGRRRRRTTGTTTDETDEQDEAGEDEDQDAEAEEETEQAPAEGAATTSSTRRRRRRRRRSDDSSDDDGDVVVRVREPRRSVTDEISGIEGSTRLEAKKQRRREGRAAGRHRAPILTEAEFLARRESVERVMLVRQREDYTQLAVLEDGVLVEHYVDRSSSTSLIGNIYLGRVQNVLPGMEAVFIDIGRGRNAVLYAGEVDWSGFDVSSESRKIEQVFKSGQSVLVQVSKDPVGAKGARLTGHISIPGRYVVYSPGGHLSGISRKLPDAERQRLKGILDEVVSSDASVIVRTAAEGATAEELTNDVQRLSAQWQAIEKKSKQGGAPQQLYSEPDLTLRIIRDTFTQDFKELIVAGHGGADDAYSQISEYINHVAPSLADRLVQWTDGDPFTKFRIDEQISKALERKVFLPSGGSLVIDRTEAMTVVDVNTGKFTGSGGNLEETVTRNNLEA